jgi:hypothetical protein
MGSGLLFQGPMSPGCVHAFSQGSAELCQEGDGVSSSAGSRPTKVLFLLTPCALPSVLGFTTLFRKDHQIQGQQPLGWSAHSPLKDDCS